MTCLEKKFEIIFLDFKDKVKVEEYWHYFDCYIDELTDLSEPLDLAYFHSNEYKQTIISLGLRQKNPLYVMELIKDDKIAGFCTYCIYHDENDKAFLLEIGIDKGLRGNDLGKQLYKYVESDIKKKGGTYIELTPYPKDKEKFWQKLGFYNTKQKDEDDKYLFRLDL